LPYIKSIREMLLFLRNNMPVLYTAYNDSYSDRIRGARRLEAEKSYPDTNISLPAI